MKQFFMSKETLSLSTTDLCKSIFISVGVSKIFAGLFYVLLFYDITRTFNSLDYIFLPLIFFFSITYRRIPLINVSKKVILTIFYNIATILAIALILAFLPTLFPNLFSLANGFKMSLITTNTSFLITAFIVTRILNTNAKNLK
ncbi:hypothetical protein ABEX78_23050 [Priestia megaterium]